MKKLKRKILTKIIEDLRDKYIRNTPEIEDASDINRGFCASFAEAPEGVTSFFHLPLYKKKIQRILAIGGRYYGN